MANNVDKDLISQREEIFKNSPIGILFFNSKGELIDANPATLKIIGFTDFESIKWLKFFDNEDIKLQTKELDKNKIIRFKAPLPSNFKSKRHEVIIDWIITESKSGYLVQMKDITAEEQGVVDLKKSVNSEIKTREELDGVIEELRNAKEEYRVMAETVPYGVWKTDAKGKPSYASPVFLELLDMVLSDLKEYGWIHKLPPEDVEPVIRKWAEHAKSGEMIDTEHRIKGADNEYRTILERGLPVRDDKGNIISWVGINLDITERKKIEEKLETALENSEAEVKEVLLKLAEANKALELEIKYHIKAEEELSNARDNLELKVQERTAELEIVIDELKRSNEELEQFAYVSSHDLQEPLRTIASFTQLLERRYRGKFDSDADEFMDYIVEAAKRMKEQIEGLLEYSRVGTKGEEFKPVDMGKILNITLQSLATLINESKTNMIIDELPTVNGDADQLQRVFQNLISNAIKFKKQEEPLKIHIFANKNEKNKEYVFSVQDNVLE